MPSLGRVIDVHESGEDFLVAVKIRGVGTKRDNSPVRKRAKFTAARKVGILEDYVPNSLQDFKDADVSELMEGTAVAEIENMQTLEDDMVQQTVIYGVRIEQ